MILSIEGCAKGVKQEHTSTIMMKQCLSTVKYFSKRIKSLASGSQLSDLFVTVGGNSAIAGLETYALYKYLK